MACDGKRGMVFSFPAYRLAVCLPQLEAVPLLREAVRLLPKVCF